MSVSVSFVYCAPEAPFRVSPAVVASRSRVTRVCFLPRQWMKLALLTHAVLPGMPRPDCCMCFFISGALASAPVCVYCVLYVCFLLAKCRVHTRICDGKVVVVRVPPSGGRRVPVTWCSDFRYGIFDVT